MRKLSKAQEMSEQQWCSVGGHFVDELVDTELDRVCPECYEYNNELMQMHISAGHTQFNNLTI